MTAPTSPQSVVLAAGTATGAGTSVALVEACRTLSEQVASGVVSSAEVRIPASADQARAVSVGLAVKERTRLHAVVEELLGLANADVYIGFADRLPLRNPPGSAVMVVQNPHLYEPSDAPSLGQIGRRFLTWWAKRSAGSADVIVCSTDASSRSFQDAVPAADPNRVVVRPIRPKTTGALREGAKTPSPTIDRIALLGDLYSYKRFDVAIDGIVEWAQNSGAVDRVHIVHCGREQDAAGVEAFRVAVGKARSAGIEVTVRGGVEHGEALAELASADLLISASEVETQGLTVLEAMAVGVPVVARSIGPISDVAGNAYRPFAVDGGAAEVAAAIGQIEDPGSRQRMVERGRKKSDMVVGWDLLPPR